MKRLLGVALLAAVASVGMSCGDKGPTLSGPGLLKVRLTSPNTGADSAIVLTITGPAALTSATPGNGLRLFQQSLGTSTKFALVGQLNNSAVILTIGIQDLGELSQYSGTIEGVAQPNYQLRALPGGYALALTR